MSSEGQRKANNALGICCISLVFLAESVVAHQRMPSPASPYIWAFEAAAAVVSLVYYVWQRAKPGGPLK